jgi:hypothetical protein
MESESALPPQFDGLQPVPQDLPIFDKDQSLLLVVL